MRPELESSKKDGSTACPTPGKAAGVLFVMTFWRAARRDFNASSGGRRYCNRLARPLHVQVSNAFRLHCGDVVRWLFH